MLQKSIVKKYGRNGSGDNQGILIYNQILHSWNLDGDKNSIETSESGVLSYLKKNIGRKKLRGNHTDILKRESSCFDRSNSFSL